MMAQNKSTFTSLPPLLFCVTLFTSAGLLFWIQPLIGKTLLPLLGGSPAVWNTCMLFFQTMLLVGYLYALALSSWLGLKAQATVHVLLTLAIAIYVFMSQTHAPALTAVQQGHPTDGCLKIFCFRSGCHFSFFPRQVLCCKVGFQNYDITSPWIRIFSLQPAMPEA